MHEEVLKIMPEILMGNDLNQALQVMPAFDPWIRNAPAARRMLALQDIYSVFVPNAMSREIYTRVYLSLMHGLKKKLSINAVRQSNENFKRIHGQEYSSIMGGVESFTVLGESGIGKSSAISRAISLISRPSIYRFTRPLEMDVIPIIVVQVPSDCSVKGLLLSILMKCDSALGTQFHRQAIRTHATIDIMIGSVSQACLSVGMIVLDEAQNFANSKNGSVLVGVLTQLINSSNVCIAMIGTPKTAVWLEQEMMLARRTLGLSYGPMKYGDEFRSFCDEILRYQYTREICVPNEAVYMWLYRHSNGNESVVVSLIHDANEIAILSGTDKLDMTAFAEAYDKRLTMLHPYLDASSSPTVSKPKRPMCQPVPMKAVDKVWDTAVLSRAALNASESDVDLFDYYQEHNISVTEVSIGQNQMRIIEVPI